MDYSIFWAKHINKPDTIELGMKVIITDKLCANLKKEVGAIVGKTVSNAIDQRLVSSKGMPYPKVDVWVVREAEEICEGYQVGCMVKSVGNKGWRNWFPLPIPIRREQFKEIDKVVEQVKLSIQESIEPLIEEKAKV